MERQGINTQHINADKLESGGLKVGAIIVSAFGVKRISGAPSPMPFFDP